MFKPSVPGDRIGPLVVGRPAQVPQRVGYKLCLSSAWALRPPAPGWLFESRDRHVAELFLDQLDVAQVILLGFVAELRELACRLELGNEREHQSLRRNFSRGNFLIELANESLSAVVCFDPWTAFPGVEIFDELSARQFGLGPIQASEINPHGYSSLRCEIGIF